MSTINDTHDDVNGELSREEVVENQNIDFDESLPSPSTSQHNINHNSVITSHDKLPLNSPASIQDVLFKSNQMYCFNVMMYYFNVMMYCFNGMMYCFNGMMYCFNVIVQFVKKHTSYCRPSIPVLTELFARTGNDAPIRGYNRQYGFSGTDANYTL